MSRLGRGYPIQPRLAKPVLTSGGSTLSLAATCAGTSAIAVPVADRISLAATCAATSAISGRLGILLAATCSGTSGTTAAVAKRASLSTTCAGTGALTGNLTNSIGVGPMTMQADTTRSVSWTSPSSGSDTETDITAKNSRGDGFRFGINTAYGGIPFSALYEILLGSVVNSGINSVNGGSQVSMATSSRDGHFHALANGTVHGFQGTEDVTGFSLVEQAPTQTALRRSYSGSVTDTNGLTWTVSPCVYPGNPGFIAWTLTLANNTGSAITLGAPGTNDSIEICTPAGLLSTTGTSPNQGAWTIDSTHALSLLGSTVSAMPNANSANTSGEPDALAFIPLSGVSGLTDQRLSLLTAKFTKWADVGLVASGYGGSQNTNRVKAKWGASIAGNSIPAGGSYTLYLLEAIHTNLAQSDLIAIVQDYLNPGSPTVGQGTLTTFNYPNHTGLAKNLPENATVVAAASNVASITLDTTAATTRYKPVIKLTGYTSTSLPRVSWGGALLTSGTDYNAVVDTVNQTCHVALQFDVIAVGQTIAPYQRTTAQLVIAAPLFLAATCTGTSAPSATIKDTIARATAVAGTGTLTASIKDRVSLLAQTVGTSGATAVLKDTSPDRATVAGTSSVAATVTARIGLGTQVSGTSSLAGTLVGRVAGAATLSGTSTIAAALTVQTADRATVLGTGSVTAALTARTRPVSQMAGQSTITATLSDADTWIAAVSASGTIAAPIRATVALASTVGATGAVTGHLLVAFQFAATTPGLSGITAHVAGLTHLSGTVAGQSGTTAVLQRGGAFVASVTSAGIVSAALSVRAALRDTVTGQSGSAAALRLTTTHAGMIAAVGQITAHLTLHSPYEDSGQTLALDPLSRSLVLDPVDPAPSLVLEANDRTLSLTPLE